MSFKADLKVSGKTYELLSVNFSLDQQIDHKGKVSSHVRGGTITANLVSTGDVTLFDLAQDDDKRVDGSIVFYKDDGQSTLKELKFNQAYVIGYSEAFAAHTTTPMNITVTFSAEIIDIGGVKFDNKWGK